MDRRSEVERDILAEAQAKNENSFLYQLNERFFFDKEKFNKLLSKCDELANEYQFLGKTDNYSKVTRATLVIFEYVFFLLFNHFSEKDVFKIKNYGKDLTADDISDYYFQIRTITHKIIY